jgi:uncharacterized protein (DUF1015 family)
MADIYPFSALRYDPKRASAALAVTQPYDKITPAAQDRYYAASPYNLVRIILGRSQSADNTADNVYTRAAASYQDWRAQGILRQDSAPSLYLYSQSFTVPGSAAQLERTGFVALTRLEDYSAKVVFRHEQTLAKPKADRLDLMRATRAHFEQLFMLYEDSGEIAALLGAAASSPPTTEVDDEYGVSHRLWQVSDPAVIDSVRGRMRDKKFIIADGHHRYETALTYRNERRASAPSGSSDAAYEFAPLTFFDLNSPSLVILPTHRVVHSLPSFSADDFQNSSRAFFEVVEVDANLDAAHATAMLQDAGRAGTALLAITPNRAFLLSKPKSAGSSALAGLSPRQQALDVVQLHKCLLEGVLKLSEESIRNQQNISYLRDTAEAMEKARTGRANITFLINPCRVQQVRDIAFAGEVMPQKSTDFYPKLLSGLATYALD